MNVDVEFEGSKTLKVDFEGSDALDVEIEDSKSFDVEFGEAKPISVQFEESDNTFGSDFGEIYGLHIDESESVIALSVEPSPDGKGNKLTYIKASGVKNTIFLPDKNTTYSLGTDTETGLTKIYATTGNAEDGTMSQRAITTELRKKVSVSVDKNELIFSTK